MASILHGNYVKLVNYNGPEVGTTARERWKKKCDELKFITEFIHLNTFYQQTWPQCAATCRWEAVASFISAETVSIILDDMRLKIKTDNICVVQQWITVQSIVQCCGYNVDTHTHTHFGRGKQGQRPDYHQITMSPHGSMTRCVVHFRLSTTYQRQNMSVWWSCTFHLIVFSHSHSSQ